MTMDMDDALAVSSNLIIRSSSCPATKAAEATAATTATAILPVNSLLLMRRRW